MRVRRVIWGPSGHGLGGSILGSILGQFWVNSEANLRPYLRNLINNTRIAFIWPWVGSSLKNMLNMGPGMGSWWVPV